MPLLMTLRQQDAAVARSSVAIRPLALAVHMLAVGTAFAAFPAQAEQAEAGSAITLDATAITDTATSEDSAVTEGSQSYTSGAVRTATPLSMSLRETPQSVTVVTKQRMQDQDMRNIADVVNNTVGVS